MKNEEVNVSDSQFLIPNSQFLISHVPIIALTASVFEEERARILAAGCQDVIRKPVQEHVLFDTVHAYLGVEYVYKDDERTPANGARVGGGYNAMPLTPETLTLLPPDVLHTLEQAAAQGNVKQVEAVIASIRHDHAPVAEALARLAKDFKYQNIWNMIQQAKRV